MSAIAVRRARIEWYFLVALVALCVLAAWLHRAAAQPHDPLDWRTAPNALGLALEATSARGNATFRWRFGPESGPVVCRLDADGDGRFDHVLADCASQKELRHAYASSGIYFATLVAESRDGRAGIARAEVAVASE